MVCITLAVATKKTCDEVVFDVEVVIDEHEVLLGIEHFEQRGGRIAAEVHRHLVDFIEHEDRVLGAGLLHHLDDLAGQGADVGAAVAADFGLIAHAAERHADELASGGLGDRHSQRSLADARRPDETEDRAFGILDQLAHGEKFKDALLDLLQAIVIFVQNFFGAGNIADFLGALLPRHGQQPVEIVAGNRGLGRHRRHGFELLEFLQGLVFDFFGHAGGFDLLLQFVEFALFAAAQFLLDGLDLLVEVILFLRLFHLALHARLDGAVDVQLLDFDVEHVGDAGQALGGIENLEQFLLLFDRELQVGGDDVGQLGRIFHAHGRNHGLVIQSLAQLHVLLEQGSDALHAGFERRVGFGAVARDADRGLHEALGVDDLQNLAALDAFDQDFDVAVGQLQALHDVDDRADLIDLVGLGFIDGGVVLGGQENLLVGRQRLFQGSYARFAAHHERRHHERKDDHVPDGHHGQLSGFELFLGCGH